LATIKQTQGHKYNTKTIQIHKKRKRNAKLKIITIEVKLSGPTPLRYVSGVEV
jgi:hypothetical protein